MSSKIMIRCDVCTGNYPPEKIKTPNCEFGAIWLHSPRIESKHFICHDCLERIGWKDEKSEETEKPADTPIAAGSSENNTSPSI